MVLRVPLLLIAMTCACDEPAPAPAEVTPPVADPRPPRVEPSGPEVDVTPAPPFPTWPTPPRRPDQSACRAADDCMYANANRYDCCVAQEGAVLARAFVDWRQGWILANCPSAECVTTLLEPAEPCGREVRCIEGRCSDACGE